MEKWISVKDRLPEVEQNVLFLTDAGVIEGWRDVRSYLGWYFITLSIHGCGCCAENDDIVTHWMPLPEPPLTTHDSLITNH